jgi:hypothetical protein
MLKRATGLVKKGLENPDRVLPYVYEKAHNKRVELRHGRGLPDQKNLIYSHLENEEFVLVVLDACRYDYFKSEYEDYFGGSLSKVWSPAGATRKWARKVWKGDFDLTYVSANPYIGIKHEKGGGEYTAEEHIDEIVKVWDFGWDSKLNTVHPSTVTDVALGEASRQPKVRQVVHYIQPHKPYVGEDSFSIWMDDVSGSEQEYEYTQEEKEDFLSRTDEVTIEEITKYDITWADRKQYGIDAPEMGVETLLSNGVITEEDLRKAYLGNVRLVLEEVKRLVERVDCPVVVTADHGDLLGEDGRYMHGRYHHPVLNQVPWLEVDMDSVESVENTKEPVDHGGTDEVGGGKVDERLRNLGYK